MKCAHCAIIVTNRSECLWQWLKCILLWCCGRSISADGSYISMWTGACLLRTHEVSFDGFNFFISRRAADDGRHVSQWNKIKVKWKLQSWKMLFRTRYRQKGSLDRLSPGWPILTVFCEIMLPLFWQNTFSKIHWIILCVSSILIARRRKCCFYYIWILLMADSNSKKFTF